MVIEALMNNDQQRSNMLKKHFGFKKDLVLRAEHVFYHELVKRVPQLSSLRRVLDETVLSKLVGKQKSIRDPRPDYFHFHEATNMGIHGEFDETADHEDDDERLRIIAQHAGCGSERVYVFRVQAHIGNGDAICKRVTRGDVAYYKMTERGNQVLESVAQHVRQCIGYVLSGVLPSDENRKVTF
jgi:hypothetical protein